MKVINLTVVLFTSLLLTGCLNRDPYKVQNPDPNHTHADFAVYVRNEQLDFSGDEFMSGASDDTTSYDEDHEHLHKYLHLHDGVGHVLHRHKPGLTIGEFFSSLGIDIGPECVTLHTKEQYCNNEVGQWQLFVNGTEVTVDSGYVFEDLDTILLSYGSTTEQIQKQLEQLTDDACLYSRRCPWRGDPPAENCIADPEVPCVVVE